MVKTWFVIGILATTVSAQTTDATAIVDPNAPIPFKIPTGSDCSAPNTECSSSTDCCGEVTAKTAVASGNVALRNNAKLKMCYTSTETSWTKTLVEAVTDDRDVLIPMGATIGQKYEGNFKCVSTGAISLVASATLAASLYLF